MDKVEEAREFLRMVGMPKAQQADICCYVILAMSSIKPDMVWSEGRIIGFGFMILSSLLTPIMELHMRKIVERLLGNRLYIDFAPQRWWKIME